MQVINEMEAASMSTREGMKAFLSSYLERLDPIAEVNHHSERLIPTRQTIKQDPLIGTIPAVPHVPSCRRMSLFTTHDTKMTSIKGAAEADTKAATYVWTRHCKGSGQKKIGIIRVCKTLEGYTRICRGMCASTFYVPTYLDELLHACRKNEPV